MTVMSFFYSRYFGSTESRNSIIVIFSSPRNFVTVVSKLNIVTTMSLDFCPKNLVTEISFSVVVGAASKNFVTDMSFS